MSIASFDVLSDSASALYRAAFGGDKPVIEAGQLMLTIMGLSIAMKAVLFVGCYWSYRSTGNQATKALAVDHGNDTCAGILSVLAVRMKKKPGWKNLEPLSPLVFLLLRRTFEFDPRVIRFSFPLQAGASHFSPAKLWWTDPVGGVLISFIIIYNWATMTKEQVGG